MVYGTTQQRDPLTGDRYKKLLCIAKYATPRGLSATEVRSAQLRLLSTSTPRLSETAPKDVRVDPGFFERAEPRDAMFKAVS